MDETVFTDSCCDPKFSEDDWAEFWDCHLVGGWTTGQTTCGLWERIAQLCQNETEQRFLHRYLGYVKDRQFPMLIPQTWIGITERRRPDFVAFIPLSFWNYRWLAIQLDAAHTEEQAENDALRDEYITRHKYEILSLKPNEKGYLEEIRTLVERIDSWMNLADTNPWEVAVEAQVTNTEPIEDVPF
jgi:hypothetical protein